MNLNAIRITASHFDVPRKILHVMKITTFIMLISAMTVSAATFAQKITLNEKRVPLEQVLEKIRIQSGYDFIYSDNMLSKAGTVTVTLKDATLDEALKASLEGQPLSYQIEDGTVVFKIKEPGILDKIKSALNLDKIDVNGRVIDDSNQPLSGATVTEKGTGNSATSDGVGFFTLKQVQANATIVISFIGYDKREILATPNMGAIKLNTATSPLDEVKVMAYTRETQRLSVSNSVTIKGEDIAKQPVQNPLLALEGRVPGLFITTANGLPGGGVKVRIQGQNTLSNGQDPLYVIDGMPYSSQTLKTTGSGYLSSILGSSGGNNSAGGGGGNPMNYINPGDIESISVLKDADATSIYGSRAANGAILITTKKGKAGPMKLDMDLQQGWGQAHRLTPMNTQQYLEMRREAFQNDGLPVPSFATNPNDINYDINGFWDQSRNTDWQKVLIGGTALYTNLNSTISGGTATAHYLVGGTYHRQSGVFPGDFADQSGGLHINLNTTSLNQKFKMNLSASYLADNNQLPPNDLSSQIFGNTSLLPDAPPLYNPDGSLNWALKPNGSNSFANPLAKFTLPTYDLKTNNLISNVQLSYNLLKGLELRAHLGYNRLETNEMELNPLTVVAPATAAALGASGRSSAFSNSTVSSWIFEPQANYRRDLGKGKLDVLIGATVNQTTGNGSVYSGTGYNSDASLPDIHSAVTVTSPLTTASTYKYAALFGRINYVYADKYILDISARRDGSSRFGSGNQFHNFAAAGAAWVFSEESFIKDKLPLLSFGKLRANYGTTGNDQIADYRYLNLYNPYPVDVTYQGISALATNGLPNPYIQWEETKKLSGGIDLGFLKDRILLSVDYSHNHSSNQLLSTPLPRVTGFTSIPANINAVVQNTAWEFNLHTVNIKGKHFTWTSNFNLTIPNSKLVSYPSNGVGYNTTYVVGQPLGSFKVFHYLGVDPTTGLYSFADSQGHPTSNPDPATDLTVLVNTLPKFYGGFENSFSYKRLTLEVFFQFVKQNGVNFTFGNYDAGIMVSQPDFLINRWQKPGDVAPYEKYTATYAPDVDNAWVAAQTSDAVYKDASYIRLKNLSLAYQLPDNWLKKMHFQSLSVFVQGQNLLTFTHFIGMDPETGTNVLPPLRILTLGVRASL